MFCQDKHLEVPDKEDITNFISEWLVKVEIETNIKVSSDEDLPEAIFNIIIDILPNPVTHMIFLVFRKHMKSLLSNGSNSIKKYLSSLFFTD